MRSRDASAPRLARLLAGRVPAAAGVAGLFLAGYFGVARLHRGEPGVDLSTPLDRAIPYAPAFAYAYAWGYAQVFLPAVLVPDERLFRRAAAAFACALLASFAVFAAFPVRVAYPPIGDAPGEWFLRKNLLFQDYGFNAFPSLHVALAVLSALSIHHARPALRVPIWLATALVAASTVLVKRHYVLDVPAGALLGWTVHRALLTGPILEWRRARAAAPTLAAALALLAPAAAARAEGDAPPFAGVPPGLAAPRDARYFEPVEVRGARKGDKALRWEHGLWAEIPSQFTAEDALLFLAEGLGERAPADAARGMREVRAEDPLTGAAGYAYLIHYGEDAARGSAAAGEGTGPRYDPKALTIAARCYRVGFSQADPALLESLSTPKSCGGSGEELLAAFHQTYTAEVRGLGVDLDYDRSRLESKVLEYWEGPVRVRRKLSYRFRLPVGGYTHDSIQDSDFYPYHYNYPVNLKFPGYFGLLVSRLSVEFATDWKPSLGPLEFAAGRARAALDGAEGEAEEKLDGAPFPGWRISGPHGTFLNLLRLSPSSPFEALLRYRDGPLPAPQGDVEEAPAPAEEEGGDARADVRRVGLILRSKDTMGTRRWRGLSTTLFPKPGDKRGPETFQAILANPLRVTVDGGEPTCVDPTKEVPEEEDR